MFRAFVLWITIHFIASILTTSQDSSNLEKELTFSIEHSFQDSLFSPRTRIHIVRNNTSGKQSLLFPERNGIFERKQLLHFAEKLKLNDLYTIKIQSHSGNHSSLPILSSIPAVNPERSVYTDKYSLNILTMLYSVNYRNLDSRRICWCTWTAIRTS